MEELMPMMVEVEMEEFGVEGMGWWSLSLTQEFGGVIYKRLLSLSRANGLAGDDEMET